MHEEGHSINTTPDCGIGLEGVWCAVRKLTEGRGGQKAHLYYAVEKHSFNLHL